MMTVKEEEEEAAELLLHSRRNKFLNNTLSDFERETCIESDKLTSHSRSFIVLHFGFMIFEAVKVTGKSFKARDAGKTYSATLSSLKVSDEL
jgi:hypothetical protein